MEYLFIYLLQATELLELLEVVLFGFIIVCIIALFILGIITGFRYENLTEEPEECKQDSAIAASKVFKKGFIISSVTLLILCLIPTKQTLLLIGGTYMGKKAVNTVITSEKMKKIDTIINLELDKRIKELGEK